MTENYFSHMVNFTNYNITSAETYVDDKFFFCTLGVLSLVCFVGSIGNGIVIWCTIFRMKKTVNVVWFLNLAVADFCYTLLFPSNIPQIILDYWSFGRFLCKFIHFLLTLNTNVSVLQLTAISVDRYICVRFPIWCHNHRRSRLAYLVVVAIWIASSVLSIPSTISVDISHNAICALDDFGYRLETLMQFSLLFLLPLIIIVFCYLNIFLHIRHKRLYRSSSSSKTIVAIIFAFFICWFPYYVFSFLHVFEVGIEISHVFSMIMIVVSSCINPILYVFIGRNFKRNVCGSFQATFEKAFIEDPDKADIEKQGRCIALPKLHGDGKEEEVIQYNDQH